MKRFLLITATALLMTGCAHWWCGDEVKQALAFPGGRHSVRVIVRNCGAMTHFLTVIEIRQQSRFFSRAQEVFQADNPHQLKFEWQKEDLLKIQCLDCYKVEIREALPSALGVNIEYTFPKNKNLFGTDDAAGR